MKKNVIPIPQKFVVFYTLDRENHNQVHQYVDDAYDAVQAIERLEIIFKSVKGLMKYDDYQIIGALTFNYAVGLNLTE